MEQQKAGGQKTEGIGGGDGDRIEGPEDSAKLKLADGIVDSEDSVEGEWDFLLARPVSTLDEGGARRSQHAVYPDSKQTLERLDQGRVAPGPMRRDAFSAQRSDRRIHW